VAAPRVVVTGLGPVSSIGTGAAAFAAALRAGRSGISRISSFDPGGFPHQNAGEVPDFSPADRLHRLDPARWARSSLFAAAAARLAAADGRLDIASTEPGRVHAVIGTTGGEAATIDTVAGQVLADGFAGLDPALLTQLPACRLAHAVSDELELTGESVTIATACAAGNYAIGYAYDLLASGEADAVFAGGSDSVGQWVHAGFYRLGALTKDACAPFDRDRSGILTGEGGAVLLLETLEHAIARGARIYAEVLGYGLNCDATHPVAPETESIAACMRTAHLNASVKASDIDYICAHGTGTPTNDSVEAQAIFAVFGKAPPAVSSIKSMIGHTMGAATGFGAIAVALAIQQGFLPPTINWSTADPALAGLDTVPNASRPATVRVAQNNGFAFGGNNAIVIFGALQ
jgi:3-oxoacyl-[acyl-carrier-protein] synthase II